MAPVTGERITTPRGGFNPTWQRHVAAYGLCERFLGPGRVLDLGCGIGHSFQLLAPRETVGVDVEASVLEGQARETAVADMRDLPFEDGSFSSVLSVQSIEHVPDPAPAFREAVRVLEPGGVAVFVTPNRLTFGRPDEIIDPYHYVEYDADQLRRACEPHFDSVEIQGIFGSERYLEIVEAERERVDRVLGLDPLRLRRFVPRRVLQALYDGQLRRARRDPHPAADAIEPGDFSLGDERLDEALDLAAVCQLSGDSGP